MTTAKLCRRPSPSSVFILGALFLSLGVMGCGSILPIGWTGSYRFTPEPPPVFRYNDGVRFASLNTEFMFDGIGDEGEATFPRKGDSLLARQHRASIASVVSMLDADIVVLLEVENELAVSKMLFENGLSDSYEVHFVQGLDTFTGQDIALISRLPIDSLGRTFETIPLPPGDRTQQVSKNLLARFDVGDLGISLVAVHFLARPTDPLRKPRRELQAEIIRRLVEREVAEGRSVIVLGDFNDYDDAIRDFAGSRPITDVLARIKEAGKGPNDDLRNLLGEVPQARRFTAHYDRNENNRVEARELSAIDHVLVSPEIYSRVREVTFVHSHDPVKVTDHFPIVFSIAPTDSSNSN